MKNTRKNLKQAIITAINSFFLIPATLLKTTTITIPQTIIIIAIMIPMKKQMRTMNIMIMEDAEGAMTTEEGEAILGVDVVVVVEEIDLN